MEFDRLAETVEKHFPQYVEIVQDARLFLSETDATKAMATPETITSESYKTWHPDEQVVENFRMPFKRTAVEWHDCCSVFDTIDADRRKYLLIGSRDRGGMFFKAEIEAYPQGFLVDTGRYGRMVIVREFECWRIKGGKVEEVLFEMSEITLDTEQRNEIMGPTRVQHDFNMKIEKGPAVWKIDGKEVSPMAAIAFLKEHRQEAIDALHDLDRNVDISLANLCYLEINGALLMATKICEPSKFVVETRPTNLKDREPKQGKVMRSPYRSHFIVLTPGEIKRRYLYDERDEATGQIPKAPHERRGHFRKLTAERYVNAKGRVLWIKPCWIGKTEGVRGKNKYIVRLDV